MNVVLAALQCLQDLALMLQRVTCCRYCQCCACSIAVLHGSLPARLAEGYTIDRTPQQASKPAMTSWNIHNIIIIIVVPAALLCLMADYQHGLMCIDNFVVVAALQCLMAVCWRGVQIG